MSENSTALTEAKTQIQKQNNVPIETITLDLSNEDSANSLIDSTSEYSRQIEVLINNAGVFFFGHAVDVEPARTQQLINLHIQTSTQLCIHFGKLMKERGRGYILNTSSISAYKNYPGIALYASSKAYLRSFTRSMRLELKPFGVHVTCLLPGATETNLYRTTQVNMSLAKRLGIMRSPTQVAHAGLRGLWRNKAEVVPGLMTKLVAAIMRYTPYWVIYQIRKRTNILD